MKLSIFRILTVTAAAFTTACATIPSTKTNFDPNARVSLAKSELEYVNQFGEVDFALAYGSREDGMHGTFGKFPPNFETPLHTHTGAYHAVVLKGVMTNPYPVENNTPKLVPGSY